MRTLFTTAAAALMIAGATLTIVPDEADAQRRGGWGRGGGHGGGHGGGWGRGGGHRGHWGGHRGHWGGHRGHWGGHWRGHGYYGRPYYGWGRPYGYGYYGYGYPAYGYGYYGGDAAWAIGAGLLGVALGTALAAPRYDRYYEERYYEAPQPRQQLCPDGSPVTAEGYCPQAVPQKPVPQQQPPPPEYLPERG
jgi:hypothetical protein